MSFPVFLLREGIASLRETRAQAFAELTAAGRSPGDIKGVLWRIDQQIADVEEAIATLELAENPTMLVVPSDHPCLPGLQ